MWPKENGSLLDLEILLKPRRTKLRIWKQELLKLSGSGPGFAWFPVQSVKDRYL